MSADHFGFEGKYTKRNINIGVRRIVAQKQNTAAAGERDYIINAWRKSFQPGSIEQVGYFVNGCHDHCIDISSEAWRAK